MWSTRFAREQACILGRAGADLARDPRVHLDEEQKELIRIFSELFACVC
jgi:hypothetical protein